jgi:hypothetical protein
MTEILNNAVEVVPPFPLVSARELTAKPVQIDWLIKGHAIDIPSTVASVATVAVANSKKMNEGHAIDIPSTVASVATVAVANSKKLEVLADA